MFSTSLTVIYLNSDDSEKTLNNSISLSVGFKQTVVGCYGFLRAVVMTGNASELRNLKHKKNSHHEEQITK